MANRWVNNGNSDRFYFLGLQNHRRQWLQPWNSDACSLKKSYDEPRQHIKKQRYYFPDKGLYSQRYGFSSSHVWIWELDHKEGHSVQFSLSVVSDSLRPHGLQQTRLPCPSLTPGACSNSCPLSRWCHPTISSSVLPFSTCLQSFPALGSLPVSQFFTSGGQNNRASASVLPMNIQDWFPLKKGGCWRTDAFELWCWIRLLRVPCTARRSNQFILKEINPEYSSEWLMLKLKL